MRIKDFKRLINSIPEMMNESEIMIHCTDDGRKLAVRTDVSQFNTEHGIVFLLVEE